ncbi:CKLF-like MARVEL transmembrane domain-containing protein 8 isoform X2 [Brachyhypopomus gauderio]|uniref:CKLF-like MARVEL transmembrane domain-containing protein 8 isoform X2 n=1 Tax=Brachyhypopomus gauderio TaxID=698409 RepID=UPI0040434BE3
MEESAKPRTIVTSSSSPYVEFDNFSITSVSYDRRFLQSAPGLLIMLELMRHPFCARGLALLRSFCSRWIRLAHTRIPQIPWVTVVLVFNCSATLLYLVSAVTEATLVGYGVKGRHDYNSWAASTFFAFLVSLSYAGSAVLSFRSWQKRDE